MISEVKRAGNKEIVGNNDARVQKLYEKIIIPTLTYNLEIARINEWEYEEIERMQAKCLGSIYRVLRSTPYWRILNETGIH